MDINNSSRKRKSPSPPPSSERDRNHDGQRNRDRSRESGSQRPPQPRPAHSIPSQNVRDPSSNAGASASSSQPPAQPRNPGTAASSNHERYKSLSDIKYPWMTDMTAYERQAKIGQGTFGEVFKAKCNRTQRVVALKKILMENEKEGFPITALREIKILQCFKNENVVELLDICSTKASDFNRYRSTFFLVFEFCEHDLAGLLSNPRVQFKEGETKKIMQQLLNGLYFIHINKALHRDMKTSNILINKDGILKIADFGLARTFSQMGTKDQPNRFTNRVVTLWYRPPELLLGDRNYGSAIDVWGAGCIMCELWTRSPILQGKDEQHQLQLIIHLCGSVTPEVYPDAQGLELFKNLELPKDIRRDIKGRLSRHIKDSLALDLIDRIFTLDPSKRVDTDTALNHDYFWTDPMPQSLGPKMKLLTQSNFEFTAASRQQLQQAAGNRAPSQAHHIRNPAGAFGDRVF
ncbi:cyclin-dependent kinase 9-like [Paramacrobiotus metropolitanus]|uniref:cyclin-dependent kinase 9-like n=1 Tax=Paramacrobiotus metropolitanus TaxID=2943436 RepID=UPI002446234A|nr:cyclin-dependent kinase 9-like [Paramacrobiotus metropolitanus]